ncbi:DNA helicase [Handroanthus impetiginosus]|uniref:DNA helicase n=1 Tax=Handroanthus impetiginosus TaxID=429701 RepID=A0A2G9I5G6_9LAMI|nr:DNA helicase [Handroanthus impetiginosus]
MMSHRQLPFNAYDVVFFNHVIYTTVTHDPSTVSQWIYDVSSLYGHRLIVGLDVEWRPNSTRHNQNPAATLQLCVGRCCLIYQLLHSPYFPFQLYQFLSHSNHTFVGVDVKSDLKKLHRDHRIGYNAKAVDLRGLAADAYKKKDLKKAGMKTLARIVLGKEMEKPKSVIMSSWDNRWLTQEQVQYACVDSFVSYEIGRKLNASAFG